MKLRDRRIGTTKEGLLHKTGHGPVEQLLTTGYSGGHYHRWIKDGMRQAPGRGEVQQKVITVTLVNVTSN